MKKSFLAGLTHAQFLRRHWQKKPLIARGALCEHALAVERDQLMALATRDTVESRIVLRARGRWQVRHGPFTRRELEALPQTGWTLLVQGVDAALEQAASLLRVFSFIPYARLDDLMVSYAVRGGGVGAHFDSYDVFLVQGTGERRWRVGPPQRFELVPDAPLRILRRFAPDREWTLAPGDVLYLPPRWAHEGVAGGPCITYSVGFRAPSAQETGSRFLEFLQDRVTLRGESADAALGPARSPARVPRALVARSARMLDGIRWSHADVAEFVGRHASEPKANVLFERPRRPLAEASFAQRVRRAGVRLALPTRMLFDERHVFVNGEAVEPPRGARGTLARLANARSLSAPLALAPALRRLLYAWYLAGYIRPGSKTRP